MNAFEYHVDIYIYIYDEFRLARHYFEILI